MKINFKLSLIAMAAVAVQSCGNAERGNRDEAATEVIDSISDTTQRAQAVTADVNLTGNEKTFINAAAAGGMMEVEAGKTAITLSKDPKIKAFAEMMVKDHTKANAELEAIAAKMGLQLPTTLPADKLAHIKTLKSLEEKKFNEQYVMMMINDHATTVKLFTEGKMLENADLKNFATKTLPIITAHYNEAVKIGKTMNLNNSGNGDDPQGVSPAPGHTH